MNTLARLGIVCGMLLPALPVRASQEAESYTYDGAGRLVTAFYRSDGTNSAIRYQYDPNGNRTARIVYGPNDDSLDYDSDSMGDLFELQYFGTMDANPRGDPDKDGLVNSSEFLLGGNPLLRDTDGDGMDDGDEALAGTGVGDPASVLKIVNVTTRSGTARMWWDVKSDRSYQLQKNDTLEPPGGWTNVGPPFVASSNALHFADAPYNSNTFFRVWVTGGPPK